MKGNSARPTLRELAAAAGVSLTTASLILNGKAARYKIAEATCKRVLEIAGEQRFVPNPCARGLAARRTFLAGVLISDDIAHSFWLRILSALEDKLDAGGYHMLLAVTRNDVARQTRSLAYMRGLGVDGIFIAPVAGSGDEVRSLARELPVVTLNSRFDGVAGTWNDDEAGSQSAVRAVLAAGHRRIACIGNAASPRTGSALRELLAAGIQAEVFASAETFLRRGKEFTAVLCHSDYVVLELYQHAREHALHIPDDFVAVGYDNMDFVSLLSPVPPTVNQYKEELGAAAAELFLKLAGAPLPVPDKLPVKRFVPQIVHPVPSPRT